MMHGVLECSQERVREAVEHVQAQLHHVHERGGKMLAVSVDLEDAEIVSTAAASYVFVTQARESSTHLAMIQEAARYAKWRRRWFNALGSCVMVLTLMYGTWLFVSNLHWPVK